MASWSRTSEPQSTSSTRPPARSYVRCRRWPSAKLNSALAAARRTVDDEKWSALPVEHRAKVLLKLADLIEAHTADFAHFVETEVGTCRRVARPGQVVRPMDHYRDMVSKAASELGHVLPQLPGPPVTGQRVIREPRGVVAAITPWNAPHLLNLWKVAPALATGNTMVLKPAPEAPSCALLLGELAVEAGIPPGVLNVVTGGAEVGQAMVADPRADMVAFTGSSAVGRAIASPPPPRSSTLCSNSAASRRCWPCPMPTFRHSSQRSCASSPSPAKAAGS